MDGSSSFRGAEMVEVEMTGSASSAGRRGGVAYRELSDDAEESPSEETPLSLMYESHSSARGIGSAGKKAKA